MSEFYIKIARKKCPNFRGTSPPAPLSYAYETTGRRRPYNSAALRYQSTFRTCSGKRIAVINNAWHVPWSSTCSQLGLTFAAAMLLGYRGTQ